MMLDLNSFMTFEWLYVYIVSTTNPEKGWNNYIHHYRNYYLLIATENKKKIKRYTMYHHVQGEDLSISLFLSLSLCNRKYMHKP